MNQEKIYVDWINACLDGNSDDACKVKSNSVSKVEINSTISITIETKRRTHYISQHRPNASITRERTAAQSIETPMANMIKTITNDPLPYFIKPDSYPIPGWTFSETEVKQCSPCNGKGNTTCRGCNGSGTNRCNACNVSGRQRCTSCGGRGYTTYQEPVRDAFGNTGYAERRKSCYGCTMGEILCRSCSGSKKIRCSSGCGGSGSITCSTCSGKGKRVLETVSTDYANIIVLRREANKGEETAQKFVSQKWAGILNRKHVSKVKVTASDRGLDITGNVDIQEMELEVSQADINLIGTASAGQSLQSSVYKVDPFLGRVIGLDSLDKDDKPSAKLLDLKGHRAVIEGIKSYADKGKKKDRADRIHTALQESYGSAFSIKERTELSEIIAKGLGRVESLGIARSWLRHFLLTLLFTVLCLIGLVWMENNNVLSDDDLSTELVEAGIFAAVIFFYFPVWLSWVLVKKRARRKLIKLGLPKDIKIRHGWGWGIFGPIITFFTMALGLVATFAIVSMISIRTDWVDSDMRGDSWHTLELMGLETAIPATEVYITRANVNLRWEPTTKAKSFKLLPKGTRVESLGLPIDDWLPVKVTDAEGEKIMGWIRQDLLATENTNEGDKSKNK